MLIFATTSLPAFPDATLSSSGATILHGPHHDAQKSTSTGTDDDEMRASNSASESTWIGELTAEIGFALATPRDGGKPFVSDAVSLSALGTGDDCAAGIENGLFHKGVNVRRETQLATRSESVSQ